VRATSKQAQDFKDANPEGMVLYLFNGDVAGPSSWTVLDQGYFSYEVVAMLAAHYPLVLNMGNHEGLDFVTRNQNQFFLDQVKKFFRKINRLTGGNFRITTANLDLTKKGKGLFKPYQDITMPNGKTLRVVGLVLEDLFKYSTYDLESRSNPCWPLQRHSWPWLPWMA